MTCPTLRANAPRPKPRVCGAARPSPRTPTRRGPPPPAGLRRIIVDKLLDFGASRRRKVIEAFYGAPTAAAHAAFLADSFSLREDGSPTAFDRAAYAATMEAAYKAAPDWQWAAASDGLTDEDGFAIVELQPTGHFTGAPYTPPAHPDWPTLAPDGRRFVLAPETVKIRVAKGKVVEIVTLPVRGGRPRGLYEALGGKVPTAKA